MTLVARAPLPLTRGDALFESALKRTHSGQAHLAGTGPAGAICGTCQFYGYFRNAKSTKRCAMYLRFAHRHGPVIPPDAAACRHFEARGGV